MTQPITPIDCPEPDREPTFARFYARWHPLVLRWAMVRYDAAAAEEIAQETLCRAFVNFRELRQEMPWPWLLTVARNVACDLHRAHARLARGDDSSAIDERAASDLGPEDVVLRSEACRRVRRALASLASEDRELLWMSAEQALTAKEIGARLGFSEGAVRVRLHRARKRFGSVFAGEGPLAALPVLLLPLRKLRRVLGSAPAAGPMTSLVAAGAAAATVGAVMVASPALRFGGHSPNNPSVHYRIATTEQSAPAPRPVVRRRHVPADAAAVRSTAGPAPASAPLPVAAHATAHVSKDPRHPGTIDDHDVDANAGGKKIVIDGHGDRGPGEGLLCRATGVGC